MAFDADTYSEDARRIERDYVDPSSTTTADIEADLREADFGNPEEVAGGIMDEEDVGLDSSNTHLDGVTTREQVADAVAEADKIGYSEDRKGALTDAVSKKVGAPRESDLRSAQARTVAQADQVTPEGGSTSVSVVRNSDGDAVAAFGGGSKKRGQSVAEETGAKYYSSPDAYMASLSAKPAPGGREALLYSDGEPVGRVDL